MYTYVSRRCLSLRSISSFLILSIGINSTTGNQYLIPTGKERIFSRAICIGAVINFVLNSLLIPLAGAFGAILASVIAETAIAVIQLIIIREEISINDMLRPLPKYLIAGLIMLAVVWFLGARLSASFINTMITIAIGACTYIVVLLVLRDSFLIENARIVIGLILKR